jgi:hypothetical protein
MYWTEKQLNAANQRRAELFDGFQSLYNILSSGATAHGNASKENAATIANLENLLKEHIHFVRRTQSLLSIEEVEVASPYDLISVLVVCKTESSKTVLDLLKQETKAQWISLRNEMGVCREESDVALDAIAYYSLMRLHVIDLMMTLQFRSPIWRAVLHGLQGFFGYRLVTGIYYLFRRTPTAPAGKAAPVTNDRAPKKKKKLVKKTPRTSGFDPTLADLHAEIPRAHGFVSDGSSTEGCLFATQNESEEAKKHKRIRAIKTKIEGAEKSKDLTLFDQAIAEARALFAAVDTFQFVLDEEDKEGWRLLGKLRGVYAHAKRPE